MTLHWQCHSLILSPYFLFAFFWKKCHLLHTVLVYLVLPTDIWCYLWFLHWFFSCNWYNVFYVFFSLSLYLNVSSAFDGVWPSYNKDLLPYLLTYLLTYLLAAAAAGSGAVSITMFSANCLCWDWQQLILVPRVSSHL